MKRLQTLSKLMIGISFPLLMLALILICVGFASSDRAWLKREYDKLDINDYTQMDTDDMIAAFMRMADYMKGNADSMDIEVNVNGERVQMYNEKERAHMVDVRALYKTLTAAKYVVIALFVTGAALALYAHGTKGERKDLLRFVAKTALFSIAGVVGVLAALGAWAAIDFNSFWTVFHIVFLDLESSTFDPAVSRMIRICPAELFFDMVKRIFILALGAMAVIAAAAWAYLARRKRSRCTISMLEKKNIS